MEEKQSRSRLGLKIGLAVGGASALVIVGNRRTRQKIIDGTKQTATAINEASKFISENREEIISQVKTASNQLSDLLKSANEDIQLISERANHLKETTLNVKETTQKTAEELKELKEKETDIEETKQLEQADNVERLPTSHNVTKEM
ncbi:hypothetical protein ACE1TI_18925 [Alteribacillus sp. JSM 102045]|uniref:hypothetical protein n=1 Tax=Alteribacillus sp. JSM 102045 TaxID=1562101 RepID=UPI0035C08ADB